MTAPPTTLPLDDVNRDLDGVLAYARRHDYAGYSKFDGLESRLTRALSLGTKLGRLVVQQAVKLSAPFNIRPCLGIRKERNPKGIALFARALLLTGQLRHDQTLIAQGLELLEWLCANNSRQWRSGKPFSGLCWGYNFHWQSPGFEAPRLMPNIIVTSFVGEALHQAWQVTGDTRWLDDAHSACRFITKDLSLLHDDGEVLCVGYVPTPKPFTVVNVNAVSAAMLAKVGSATGEAGLVERARRQVAFVARAETQYGAWYYTHPPADSPISHDNYHTGGILDGLNEYMLASGDETWRPMFERGLAYYRKHLFEADGAPRWMNDKAFPRDVHGAAQGIITFAKLGDHQMAAKVDAWTRRNLRRPDGAYRYQLGRTRLTSRPYTLMRWCNAWMAWALANAAALPAK